jgi:fructose-1,6-bisphosphatase/inositol monophosphatase family enzyme
MSTGFTEADLMAVATLLRDAGRAEVMPNFRRLSAQSIRTKSGPLDLVTDADEAAERLIEAGLRDRFSSCRVVGEEAAAADPSLLPGLAAAPPPELLFFVDPIDGTANYIAGLPLFGMMAAVVVDGAVIASCIHDPVLDESYLALRGAGAWATGNIAARRPLRVAAPAPFARMTGSMAWRFLPEPRRSRALRGSLGVAAAWDFRCAAHQYRLLADGHCHFSLYNRLLPWDHAPGWLLHQEAGGHSARFDASAYDPFQTTGGLICAPDQASWTLLHDSML